MKIHPQAWFFETAGRWSPKWPWGFKQNRAPNLVAGARHGLWSPCFTTFFLHFLVFPCCLLDFLFFLNFFLLGAHGAPWEPHGPQNPKYLCLQLFWFGRWQTQRLLNFVHFLILVCDFVEKKKSIARRMLSLGAPWVPYLHIWSPMGPLTTEVPPRLRDGPRA